MSGLTYGDRSHPVIVLRGILPFLGYAIVSSFADWRIGALTGAIIAAVVIALARREGRGPGELVIETCGLVWFALCTAIGYLAPGVGLRPYVGAIGQLVLAGAVAITLVRRRPFTLPMSRRQAPEGVWEHPVFLAFNTRISAGWAIGLGISGLVMLALVLAGVTNVWLQVLAVLLGVLLPALYQRREIAAFTRAADDPATWA